jgi:hypothetical protein
LAERNPVATIGTWMEGELESRVNMPDRRKKYSYVLAHPEVANFIGADELEEEPMDFIAVAEQMLGRTLL